MNYSTKQIQNNYFSLKKRYVGLDVFRIISMISICAFHTTIHLGAYYGVFHAISQMGAVFMTAFFMMSGYSLFVNYANYNITRIDVLEKYLLKRIIGIVPVYYIVAILFIIFSFVTTCMSGGGSHSLVNELILAPIELLGLQSNFHSLFNYSHNGGTWFISCILMCYFTYPLIQEVSKQISSKAKVKILLLLIFIMLYAPIVQYRFQTISIYANPFFRLLEFTIGVLLASLKTQLDQSVIIKKYFYKWKMVLFVDILMIIGVSLGVYLKIAVGNYMLYNWICLPCFVVLLIGLSGLEQEQLSSSKFISYCSTLGYSFFLAQFFSNKIAKIVINYFGINNNFVIIVLGWSVCIIIAISMREMIEKPITKKLQNINYVNINM